MDCQSYLERNLVLNEKSMMDSPAFGIFAAAYFAFLTPWLFNLKTQQETKNEKINNQFFALNATLLDLRYTRAELLKYKADFVTPYKNEMDTINTAKKLLQPTDENYSLEIKRIWTNPKLKQICATFTQLKFNDATYKSTIQFIGEKCPAYLITFNRTLQNLLAIQEQIELRNNLLTTQMAEEGFKEVSSDAELRRILLFIALHTSSAQNLINGIDAAIEFHEICIQHITDYASTYFPSGTLSSFEPSGYKNLEEYKEKIEKAVKETSPIYPKKPIWLEVIIYLIIFSPIIFIIAVYLMKISRL